MKDAPFGFEYNEDELVAKEVIWECIEEAIELRSDDFTFPEIAEATGIPVVTLSQMFEEHEELLRENYRERNEDDVADAVLDPAFRTY